MSQLISLQWEILLLVHTLLCVCSLKQCTLWGEVRHGSYIGGQFKWLIVCMLPSLIPTLHGWREKRGMFLSFHTAWVWCYMLPTFSKNYHIVSNLVGQLSLGVKWVGRRMGGGEEETNRANNYSRSCVDLTLEQYMSSNGVKFVHF